MTSSLVGTLHRHRLRVRFAETDQMRVAHHSSYVPWIEEARTEWMRANGRSYRSMEDEGHSLAVTRLDVRYRASALYDDLLEIETVLSEIRKASLDFDYKIWRVDEGRGDERGSAEDPGAGDAAESRTLLAEAGTRLALLGADGRPRRIHEELLRPEA